MDLKKKSKKKTLIKPLQHRKPFEDTCGYQEELRFLIETKIRKNIGLSNYEMERARFIFPRAILSHAVIEFQFRNVDGRVTVFRHMGTFFSQIIKLRRGTKVILTDTQSGQKYVVEIRDSWIALLNELEYLFPYARNEALHISPEIPVMEVRQVMRFQRMLKHRKKVQRTGNLSF